MELANIEKFKVLDIDTLVPADWNYKDDDKEMGEKLSNNLKRNGQIENIIVRLLPTGAYEVVNGNHRYFAMKALGATKIVAYDMGEITTEHAMRLAIETNETKFESDNVKLSKLIAESLIPAFGLEDLEVTMPYNADMLKLMSEMSQYQFPTSADGDKTEGGEGSDDKPEEKFETLRFQVPVAVADIFREAMAKVRASVSRATRRPCDDDIRPIEMLALIVRDMTDKEIDVALYGEHADAVEGR